MCSQHFTATAKKNILCACFGRKNKCMCVFCHLCCYCMSSVLSLFSMHTGMVSRSAVISERRAAREKRRETMAQEKAERLAREEEEKKRAEREAREALVAQKRVERRLAKQASQDRFLTQSGFVPGFCPGVLNC